MCVEFIDILFLKCEIINIYIFIVIGIYYNAE